MAELLSKAPPLSIQPLDPFALASFWLGIGSLPVGAALLYISQTTWLNYWFGENFAQWVLRTVVVALVSAFPCGIAAIVRCAPPRPRRGVGYAVCGICASIISLAFYIAWYFTQGFAN